LVIQEQTSVLGAVVALVYVATISSILWWMLHPPPTGDVEQHVRRVTREASRFARILVPVQGDDFSDRLVALASQMARYRGATLDVLYLIEVPLTLPITAEMVDQHKLAADAFSHAAKIANKYDVKINQHIERSRQAGPGIVQYARQNNIDLLLMGDLPKVNRRGTRYARTVEYVFENAPCDVIIHRPVLA
jgi:nucleotide-binding universal stress UspA family protein